VTTTGVAVVTGGGSGLGREIARALLGAGWRQLGPLDDWLRDHVGPSRTAR